MTSLKSTKMRRRPNPSMTTTFSSTDKCIWRPAEIVTFEDYVLLPLPVLNSFTAVHFQVDLVKKN
jgi:hypothetical protein